VIEQRPHQAFGTHLKHGIRRGIRTGRYPGINAWYIQGFTKPFQMQWILGLRSSQHSRHSRRFAQEMETRNWCLGPPSKWPSHGDSPLEPCIPWFLAYGIRQTTTSPEIISQAIYPKVTNHFSLVKELVVTTPPCNWYPVFLHPQHDQYAETWVKMTSKDLKLQPEMSCQLRYKNDKSLDIGSVTVRPTSVGLQKFHWRPQKKSVSGEPPQVFRVHE